MQNPFASETTISFRPGRWFEPGRGSYEESTCNYKCFFQLYSPYGE